MARAGRTSLQTIKTNSGATKRQSVCIADHPNLFDAAAIATELPQAALVGDLFRGSIIGHSAEIHFYICDRESNRSDIRRLLKEMAPSASQFFTGHFGPVRTAPVMERFEIK